MDAYAGGVARRYVAQLEFMEPRFPDARVALNWSNTFTPSAHVTASNLAYEKACSLYNVGAVEATLGKQLWMEAAGGDQVKLKAAMVHFQTAAGAFEYAEQLCKDGKFAGEGDMCLEALSVLHAVMLGQAHECILKKALLDNPKSEIASRVSTQIAEHFDRAHTRIISIDPTGTKTHPWKMLPAIVRIKSMHFRAFSHYQASIVSESKAQYGEEVARLHAASEICDNVAKIAKGWKVDLGVLAGTLKMIQEKYVKAKTDNDSIFHEKVVAIGLLPEIQPIAAAKLIRPAPTEVVADIFSRLVPMKVHLAASEYSELKAQLARQINAEIAEKDMELEHALRKMDLITGGINERNVEIPPTVFQKGTFLRDARRGMSATEAMLIENLRRGKIAGDAISALAAECKQKQAAGRPGHALTALMAAIVQVQGSVMQACRLDQEAGKILHAIKPNLALLAGPVDDVRAALPAAGSSSAMSPEHAAAAARLEELLGKVKLLRTHRTRAIEEFRRSIEHSDITASLIGSTDASSMIQAEMAKHNVPVGKIRQNFASQNKLLPAIVEANARCSTVRQAATGKKGKQEAFVSKLLDSYTSYEELARKAQMGSAFYVGIDKTVGELRESFTAASLPPKRPVPVPGGQVQQPMNGMGMVAGGQQYGLKGGAGGPAVGGAGQSISPLDAAIATFESRVAQMRGLDGSGRSGFDQEWRMLEQQDRQNFKPADIRVSQQFRHKNRYNDILPYDRDRIKMHTFDPRAPDNYINASLLKCLLPGSPDFIACQGPLPTTGGDFWKMVKQQRVRVIVMVTNCVEGGKVKCDQYWPGEDGRTNSFPKCSLGNAVDITKTGEQAMDGWIERHFTIVEHHPDNTRSTRHIQQFHFTAWPDRGVPASSVQFIKVLHATMAAQFKCQQEAKSAGEAKVPPCLVHCSAGVGRTGTFCAVYAALNSLPMIGKNGVTELNVVQLTKTMRMSRRFMIQSQPQFEFTYNTILHAAKEFQSSFNQRKRTVSGGKAAGLPVGGSQAATRVHAAASPPPLASPSAPAAQARPARPPPAAAAQFTECFIQNRTGNCSFMNGTYKTRGGNQLYDGMAIYQHAVGVPAGFGAASGKPLMLYYHGANRAWVVAMELGSPSVLAYISSAAPQPWKAQGVWMVTEASGYQPDQTMRLMPGYPTMQQQTANAARPRPETVWVKSQQQLAPTPTPTPTAAAAAAAAAAASGGSANPFAHAHAPASKAFQMGNLGTALSATAAGSGGTANPFVSAAANPFVGRPAPATIQQPTASNPFDLGNNNSNATAVPAAGAPQANPFQQGTLAPSIVVPAVPSAVQSNPFQPTSSITTGNPFATAPKATEPSLLD